MNDPIPRVDNFRYLNVFTSSFPPLFLEPFPTLDVTHFLDMLSICLAVSGWSSPWAEPLGCWCTLHLRKAGSFTEAAPKTGLPLNRHLYLTFQIYCSPPS